MWPFAVRYAAHQLNLWPCVSVPETSPTLRWTREVGNAAAFRVWGALSLVRDTTAGKLSPRTLRCVFLGSPTDAPPWQFYHPDSQCVPSSQDVTFDESVCFYRLHPHVSSPLSPPPLFLVPAPPPRGVTFVDNTVATRCSPRLETPPGFLPRPSSPPLQPVVVDSGAAGGGDPKGADFGGACLRVTKFGGAGLQVTKFGGAGSGGADSRGAGSEGADTGGPTSPSGGGVVGSPAGGSGIGQQQQSRRRETLSPKQLRDWVVQRGSPGGGGYGAAGARGPGAASAGGARAGGAGGTAAAGTGGTGAAGAGGARAGGAGGTGAASAGGTEAAGTGGARAGGTGGTGAAGAGGTIAGGAGGARAAGAGGAGGSGAGGARCTGAAGARGAGAAGAGGARAVGARGGGAGGTESEFVCPPSVGGELALSSDVLEDRKFKIECLAAALPRFSSMLLCPEGILDALDIPTPRSYAESITAFLQGSLHEEIWLRRPPGFIGSFPEGTQWILRWPVYGLCQVPREWHDTLRMTLVALGFASSTADPSLFPVHRPYSTDILHPRVHHPKQSTVHHVLHCFGFRFSLPQPNPMPTGHLLLAPPSDESIEPIGLYSELVGCLITLGMGLVLGGRGPVVLTGHSDASWADDQATQRPSQGYSFNIGFVSVSWRSTRLSSVLGSSCEAKIYDGAMAVQELRWLTYLLADLGERPCFPPVMYVDNKAMIALCLEQRLEHRTKHIALPYFLARKL
ncbi:unnamed protein product [Closterium sp. NIES-53]